MRQDNVIDSEKPEPFIDEQIRPSSGREPQMEAMIEFFINQYVDLRDEIGRQRIVHNGYRPGWYTFIFR
jgi:hypothetical protein